MHAPEQPAAPTRPEHSFCQWVHSIHSPPEDQFPPPDPLVVHRISLSIKNIPSQAAAPRLGPDSPCPKFRNIKFCVLHKKSQKIGACEAKPCSFSSPSHVALIYFQAKVECGIFFATMINSRVRRRHGKVCACIVPCLTSSLLLKYYLNVLNGFV